MIDPPKVSRKMYVGFFEYEDMQELYDVEIPSSMNEMEDNKKSQKTSLQVSTKDIASSKENLNDLNKTQKTQEQVEVNLDVSNRNLFHEFNCIPEESPENKHALSYRAYKCNVHKVNKKKLKNKKNEMSEICRRSKRQKLNSDKAGHDLTLNKSLIEVQQLRGFKLTEENHKKTTNSRNNSMTRTSDDQNECKQNILNNLKTKNEIFKTPSPQMETKANDNKVRRRRSKLTSTPNLKRKSAISPFLLLSPVSDFSTPSTSKTSKLKSSRHSYEKFSVKRKLMNEMEEETEETNNNENTSCHEKKKNAKTKHEEKVNSWAEQVNAEFSDIEMYELEIE